MKKKVSNSLHEKRDDQALFRLFFHLTKRVGLRIEKYLKIKENVLLVHVRDGIAVLKGYRSRLKAEQQLFLQQKLHDNGFIACPRFQAFPDGSFIVASEEQFWTISEYFKPHRVRFSFQKKEDRIEGMKLLDKLHRAATGLPRSFTNTFTEFSLYTKWERRFTEFYQNEEQVNNILGKAKTKRLLQWGEQFLVHTNKGKLEQLEELARKRGTFIHGDTAHHNFIYTDKGQYTLIDFDLAAPAPYAYEFLQYFNRILPYSKWNLNEVAHHVTTRRLLDEAWFLLALIYPADLYREWNRCLRNPSQQAVDAVRSYTLRHFDGREKFNRNLAEHLNLA